MKKRVKYPTAGKLPAPGKPFASINIEKDSVTDDIVVSANVLLDKLTDDYGTSIENAEFALALDGSASMENLFGSEIGPFGHGMPNKVEPIVKSMLSFLSTYSRTGAVDFAYWSVGAGGKEVEGAGSVQQHRIDSLTVRPRKALGRSTLMMPILDYFLNDRLKNAPWSLVVIITDGLIDDIEKVVTFSEQLASSVASGGRRFTKLVLIGLGPHVALEQLDRLDNLDAPFDLWSCKLASEMEELHEIFDEVMSEHNIVGPAGKILDNNGAELKTYNDGLRAKLTFPLKKGSTGFKVLINDKVNTEQDISEGISLLK